MSDIGQKIHSKIQFLQSAVSRKELEIASLRSDLVSLRAQIDILKEVATPVAETNEDRIIQDKPAVNGSGHVATRPKYATMNLVPAARDALYHFPHGASIPEVRDYLLHNGFEPQGENFHNSLATTIKRFLD